MNLFTQKSDDVHLRLLAKVKALAAGTPLPSVREMMKDFSVSQATVDRALRRLKDEGAIVTRPGKGMFVSETRNIGTVAIVTHETSSSFTQGVAASIRKACDAARFNVRMLYTTPRTLDDALKNMEADAAVVIPSSRPEELTILQAHCPCNRPLVMLDIVSDAMEINAVGTDNAFGGALAARHLLELGHRKLAVLLAEPDTINNRKRLEGFLNQAALQGINDVEILRGQFNIGLTGGTYGVAHHTITKRLSAGVPAFTALFTDSDRGGLGAMKAFYEAGYNLPGQMSVIGFDDVPEAAYFHPSLTTIRQDLDSWAEAALEIIHAHLRRETETIQRIRIKPELILRESTSRPANGK